MEIKSNLNKPYSESERIQFVVENNHKKGYEIKETETALEAWGYTTEELQAQQMEMIKELSCTKRVFALMLQELGVTYAQIKELIAENEQAQLEWELCVELKRSNSLLDVMAQRLNITSEMLDRMFMYANGLVKTLKEAE